MRPCRRSAFKRLTRAPYNKQMLLPGAYVSEEVVGLCASRDHSTCAFRLARQLVARSRFARRYAARTPLSLPPPNLEIRYLSFMGSCSTQTASAWPWRLVYAPVSWGTFLVVATTVRAITGNPGDGLPALTGYHDNRRLALPDPDSPYELLVQSAAAGGVPSTSTTRSSLGSSSSGSADLWNRSAVA